MGQKVNPIGYRLGVNKTWQSTWYSKDNYQKYLINDIRIREYLEKNLKEAAIASVIVDRKNNKCEVSIYTAKPGVIIGRGGEDIEKFEKLVIKIGVILAVLGFIEEFILGDKFWLTLKISKYYIVRGFGSGIFSHGLPGDYYSADFSCGL